MSNLSKAAHSDEFASSLETIVEWLLEDADRCAGVVADAYAGWDTDLPWRETLLREIEYRRLHP